MNRKVLIVEDSGMTLMQVGELVRESFNAEIIEAENGRQGLEKLESSPSVDLIIVDIEMPEMNGVEFIKRVRASEDHAFVPILVMTTLGQIRERDDALNSGADAFIQKPVTLDALQALLKDVW